MRALYLDQEVRAEGLTRNISGFTRFLESVSFSHGAQLNVAAVARECEVERKVVAGYVGSPGGSAARLPAAGLPQTRQASNRCPREDLPVRCRRVPFTSPQGAARPPRGRWTAKRWRGSSPSISAPGPHTPATTRRCSSGGRAPGWEVDFVVYGESGLQAFEVKNARRVHSADLRALRAFREDYPEAETAVLYRGSERLRIDNIWCLPIADFLRRTTPNRDLLADM